MIQQPKEANNDADVEMGISSAPRPGTSQSIWNWRFFFAVACYLVCSYINGVVQTVVQRRSRGQDTSSLPDLGYAILPHIRGTQSIIPDVWVSFLIFITVVHFGFKSTIREVVFRRLLFISSILLLLRAISISVTILSPPPNDCVETIEYSAFVEGFLLLVGVHHTCSDLVFSGHTVHLTVLALSWQYYSDGSWECLKSDRSRGGDPGTYKLTMLVVWLWAVIGYLLILCTRFHYSLDVFIGILVTVSVFKMYHTYISTLSERSGKITRFFCWFEFVPELAPAAPNAKETSKEELLASAERPIEKYQPPRLQTNNVDTVPVDVPTSANARE